MLILMSRVELGSILMRFNYGYAVKDLRNYTTFVGVAANVLKYQKQKFQTVNLLIIENF